MADEPKFPRKAAAAFYFFLIVVGLAYYLVWGLLYGTWNILDKASSGVYALTILLVGFGITGYLLYRTPTKKKEGDESKASE